jgi:hypothetical protein
MGNGDLPPNDQRIRDKFADVVDAFNALKDEINLLRGLLFAAPRAVVTTPTTTGGSTYSNGYKVGQKQKFNHVTGKWEDTEQDEFDYEDGYGYGYGRFSGYTRSYEPPKPKSDIVGSDFKTAVTREVATIGKPHVGNLWATADDDDDLNDEVIIPGETHTEEPSGGFVPYTPDEKAALVSVVAIEEQRNQLKASLKEAGMDDELIAATLAQFDAAHEGGAA